MRALGVGCIWLDYSQNRPIANDSVPGADVMNELKAGLEEIDSISNVKIYPDPTDRDVYWHGAAVDYHDNDEPRIIPIFPNSWISFEIYIPFRVQEQIYDGASGESENFHVDMYFDFYMPVTYISYETKNHDARPSSAIVIVRKYLEQKLSNKEIISDCVGPSPFHANFIIVDDNQHEGPPIFERAPGRALGYEKITIKVKSTKQPIPILLNETNDVFSAFYSLSVQRGKIITRSSKIMRLANTLLYAPDGKNLIARAAKTWSDGKIIAQINRELTLGRLDDLYLEEFLLQSSRNDSLGDNTPLSYFFKEFRELNKTAIWGGIENLVKFSEDRRQKLFANLSVAISGILGGILGALIASTLTYLLTRPVAQPVEASAVSKPVSQTTAIGKGVPITDRQDRHLENVTSPSAALINSQ